MNTQNHVEQLANIEAFIAEINEMEKKRYASPATHKEALKHRREQLYVEMESLHTKAVGHGIKEVQKLPLHDGHYRPKDKVWNEMIAECIRCTDELLKTSNQSKPEVLIDYQHLLDTARTKLIENGHTEEEIIAAIKIAFKTNYTEK